ncbi:DMT family transporter [Histidinibacterium aquaticum]|uniref:DMT family transporter n=1 Tax=Histidinibacterium aquaticum TaxID=2613962 RepID=UPI001CC6CF14|nr:DMT family transporter [Histidinibacterium aquaticum]
MQLFALTALTMCAFAANSVLNRLAVADGSIGALEFAAVRVAAGALALGIIVLLRRRGWRSSTPFASAVALTGYMLGFSLAYLSIGAGAGALILFGTVQITMFVAALRAGEDIPTGRWVGTALAFLGLVVLVGRIDPTFGQVLAIISMAAAGLGWGIYSLLGRAEADPLGATTVAFVLALPVVAVAALASGSGAFSARGLVLASLSGALTSGLGYALWYAILPRLQRTSAALAQLSVPVLAALGGVTFIGEPVTLHLTLATILVVGGVTLGIKSGKARARR